jgi:tRNA A-37 threonylcarbamoyl transferase component Bud32
VGVVFGAARSPITWDGNWTGWEPKAEVLWEPVGHGGVYGVCMTFSVPLASGRDADVFAMGEGRVLRRYRDGGDVAVEAAVMGYLGGCGFPVPAVYRADGPDLVMERVVGPTLLTALVSGEVDPGAGGRILADLHDRLRTVPARVSQTPGVRVLHMDLHPDNVLLGPRGPVVIDWCNTREGEHDLDVAMSALIIAQAAVGARGDRAALARAVLSAFLRAADGEPLRELDNALAVRRRDPNMSDQEIADLPLAVTLVRAESREPKGRPR